MNSSEQFHKQQYKNLENFRKTDASMKMPTWFVLEGETLYTLTVAYSSKVKRILNNSRVYDTPCKVSFDFSPT